MRPAYKVSPGVQFGMPAYLPVSGPGAQQLGKRAMPRVPLSSSMCWIMLGSDPGFPTPNKFRDSQ